ncbi:uncharacterized protein [Anoplolepis gracilipes]|uniref:uncharacterized protein n=1 Tax=Anoplolepis gracilipes TaxID=354296 RepID=UPI003BA3CAA1
MEYNKNSTITRSKKSLRLCWDNIKRDTRKYCATQKRECYRTGGGVVDVKKNDLFERAREIMGETTVNGLSNPFDSDHIEDVRSTIGSILENDNISQEDENDSAEIFSQLLKNKEINDWKSWEPKKLKSQKCSLLQIEDSPTLSQNVKSKKIKLDENDDTINKAKTELIHYKQIKRKKS